MEYFSYALRRLAAFIPTLLVVSAMIFFMLRLSGVDPISVMLGERQATTGVIEALRTQFHLNEPIAVQYLRWLLSALRGDFGVDYINRQNVGELILSRTPVTLGLVVLSNLMGTAAAVLFGVLAAIRRNTWVDQLISVFVLFLTAMPSFLTAILVLMASAKFFPFLSFTGAFDSFGEYAGRIFLPSVVLSFNMLALVTRIVRSGMIEQLKSHHITTARSKGLPGSVIIWKHAFRNASIPVLTIVSIFAGTTISGAVLVESVFSLPGLGGLLVNGIKDHNYPVVQAILLLLVVLFLLIGLLFDLIYARIDPRIRLFSNSARIETDLMKADLIKEGEYA
ncbi:MAG: ABC transporter permease [Synergistaceae bacterium]|jgi:peptide/nickel transport system permease protein|nr:ABC transporter permease [Synergistaceae bacterium]